MLKVVMPKNVSQSKDDKKWATNAYFQTPASTGHIVETASTNTDIISIYRCCHLQKLPETYATLTIAATIIYKPFTSNWTKTKSVYIFF